MNDLLRRKEATEATLARYRGKVFDWSKGITCVHLARCQMRKMGHKPPTLPRFRSMLGDLAVAPSGEGLGSIMVCAGPHKLLGWREDAPELIILDVKLNELSGAWRV
jgi:hypothetical protein